MNGAQKVQVLKRGVLGLNHQYHDEHDDVDADDDEEEAAVWTLNSWRQGTLLA